MQAANSMFPGMDDSTVSGTATSAVHSSCPSPVVQRYSAGATRQTRSSPHQWIATRFPNPMSRTRTANEISWKVPFTVREMMFFT